MNAHNDPQIDIWHIAIPVSDIERSLAFYTDIIGMKLVGRDEYPSKKQAFVAVKPGGFTIELFQPQGKYVEKPMARPDHLAFECGDIHALRSRIAPFMKDDLPHVEEFDNGVKYLGLRDPDNVLIEVFQGRALYEASIAGTS